MGMVRFHLPLEGRNGTPVFFIMWDQQNAMNLHGLSTCASQVVASSEKNGFSHSVSSLDLLGSPQTVPRAHALGRFGEIL